MRLVLTKKIESPLPIGASGLSPDRLASMGLHEIEKLPLLWGNSTAPLAELFDVQGDLSDGRLQLVGDLTSVHHIGAGMQHGEIHVEGNAGRHLGSRMLGGTIEIVGDAGDWLGAEMEGGLIRVHGSAGDAAGASYSGSSRGMRGGTILISGNAGKQVGARMRRGLIAVRGEVGELLGWNMLAGSLLVFGNCGRHPGAGMKRGTIGLFGTDDPQLLPSFRWSCDARPVAINLLLLELQRLGFADCQHADSGSYRQFRGDLLELGKGEIFFRQR